MSRKILILSSVALALALATSGCVNGDLDDPSTGEVEMEIELTDSPAIEGQLIDDPNNPGNQICELTITEWSMDVANLPKTELATTSPFNDIVVEAIDISYAYQGGGPTPPDDRRIGAPGTVAPNSTLSITFEPILLQDLGQVNANTTLDLTMVVRARTNDNTRLSETILEQLLITCTSGG